jgi:hypothetical protein
MVQPRLADDLKRFRVAYGDRAESEHPLIFIEKVRPGAPGLIAGDFQNYGHGSFRDGGAWNKNQTGACGRAGRVRPRAYSVPRGAMPTPSAWAWATQAEGRERSSA